MNPILAIQTPVKGITVVNAYPEKREDVLGLIATSCDGEMFVIVSECAEEFPWQGQTVNNIRRNKWWSYRLNDESKESVLLCIDKHDIDQSRYATRFFKKVES